MDEILFDCPKCKSDKAVIKAGLSRGKQRYKCKACDKHFTHFNYYVSSGKGKHNYSFSDKLRVCKHLEENKNKGLSARRLAKLISDTRSSNLNHTTILFWMKKYEVYKETGEEF
jgi:transposase-like protein